MPVVADMSALENGSNVGDVLRRAFARRPSVLFVGSDSAQFVAKVVHTGRGLGFSGTLIGGNTLNDATTASLLGRAGADALSGAAWTSDVNFPANAAFAQAYQNAYRQLPGQFAAQAFTAVEILAAAPRKARPGWAAGTPVAAQRAGVQFALADTALMTPLGPFRFTVGHDVDQIVWIVWQSTGTERTDSRVSATRRVLSE